jgi:hypothetical protein
VLNSTYLRLLLGARKELNNKIDAREGGKKEE